MESTARSRCDDTRPGREVGIKVLPEEAADPERLRRLEDSPITLCGERRLSLYLLRQAQGGGYIVSSAMDREPFFNDLRSDPEFRAIRATAIARQKRFLAHRGGGLAA